MRAIDKDWVALFETHHILERINAEGIATITATDINRVHEARLMTKFDNKANLPYIFTANNISILPVTRGSYALGRFRTYESIEYADIENISISLPSHIESIDTNNIYSESVSLHCAYAAKIIDDVAGEETIPTVSGRMSSGSFNFTISNALSGTENRIEVQNSQVEIDGGYEGLNNLVLVEAKNYSSDDFLIRQLYYPYRLWHSKINKNIIPAFMTFSNDVFSFFIYRFDELNNYNSLRLIRQKNYIIAPEQITIDDIYSIMNRVTIIPEPQVPFSQADSFARVIDLFGLLVDNQTLTRDYITNNYVFVQRQTGYYTNAAIYLGFVEKTDEGYSLSQLGKNVMARRHKPKNLSIVEAILKHQVFNRVLREYFTNASPVGKERIVEIMHDCMLYHIGDESTYRRRASTITSWIEWILSLINS